MRETPHYGVEGAKMRKYKRGFDIPDESKILIWVLETSGYFGKRAREFVQNDLRPVEVEEDHDQS